MKRRDFLLKSTIAAAGLCTLPLMAQTDLSLDIWKDTERALRHDILSDAFPHHYIHNPRGHRSCGHPAFYADHKIRYGETVGIESVILPDGRRVSAGDLLRCNGCSDLILIPDDGEVLFRELLDDLLYMEVK